MFMTRFAPPSLGELWIRQAIKNELREIADDPAEEDGSAKKTAAQLLLKAMQLSEWTRQYSQ